MYYYLVHTKVMAFSFYWKDQEMKTLLQFANQTPESLPMATACLLSDLAEARGKQELFTKQSPQKLKKLRENALIESAISSNRIEGVQVDQSRIGTLVHGTPHLRDRDEVEVSGYRDALKWIHEKATSIPVDEKMILQLHRHCRGDIWDAGKYKDREVDIIENFPDGRSRVRFKTVSAQKTPEAMASLVELWKRGIVEKWVPQLLLVTALNLDFLSIHPFRDGNGRVSRLLLLHGFYFCGFEAGRYISIERLIENNKERYYETLELSSENWHEGNHNPWYYINFILFILKQVCNELENRVGEMPAIKGEKSALVHAAIMRRTTPFKVSDIQVECPGVSVDLIRKILKDLRDDEVECLGRGHQAQWRRIN